MRLLLDENVRKEVADFLRNSGHDLLAVSSGIEDYKIANLAKEDSRVILTHDQHFANILMYPPEQYSGIIRIKIHPPNAKDIIDALINLLNKLSFEEIKNKLIILEKNGFRLR